MRKDAQRVTAVFLAPYCDAVVNWGNRLAWEVPSPEKLAGEAGGRIPVPACGTGGHGVVLAG
jgi:hypothetical protein